MPETFVHSQRVRYMEVDAQGVVFNAWYLAYVDEAMGAFLEQRRLTAAAMVGDGYDIQLVHAELDWKAGLSYPDRVAVAVIPERTSRTSFTMRFEIGRADGPETCVVRVVYVVVATDGSGKRPIPAPLAEALGTVPAE